MCILACYVVHRKSLFEACNNFKLLFLKLAKLAGNKVVATCGGREKAKLLKDLGVDRVIDYKAEDIKTVGPNNIYYLSSLPLF